MYIASTTHLLSLCSASANVGDCRAVLCRGGKALRLSGTRLPLLCVCMAVRVSSSSLDMPVAARVRGTEDHKPQNPSERERIREAGGDVVVMGEVARVTTGEGAKAAASGSDVSSLRSSQIV